LAATDFGELRINFQDVIANIEHFLRVGVPTMQLELALLPSGQWYREVGPII
jgi:hypothetical protein